MPDPYTYPDVERLVVDYLTEQFGDVDPEVTVGVDVPPGWTSASSPHVQVVNDGAPAADHPVAAHATVRLVARAGDTTDAKRIVSLAHGLLLAHPGGEGIASTRYLTGPLPAQDPETRAELCSATARVTVRSQPIVPSAS